MIYSAPNPSFDYGFARAAWESANPDLWEGLRLAHVPALGIQGASLEDVSGNGYRGTLTNMDPATAWTSGPLGKALTFDGVDDMVVAGDARCDPYGLTLYAVVTPTFTNAATGKQAYASILARNDPAVADPYSVFSLSASGSAAKYTFSISTGAAGSGVTAVGTTSLASGRMDHVAATYDGATMRLYVGGKLERNVAATLAIGSSNWYSGVSLGGFWPSYTADNLWKGAIHAAYLYSRPLSVDELQRLYADPLAPWRLVELTHLGITTSLRVSKMSAHAILGPTPGQINVSKLAAHVILGPYVAPAFNPAWAARNSRIFGGGMGL